MTSKEPEKWLKVEIRASAGNFLDETGAQGVFSESLLPPGADDFPEAEGFEVINAFFPADVRSEKRIYNIRKYLKSLEEIFPEVSAPSLETEIITDPDWGEQWKKYFKPIRVCKNIVVKPTWERYAPESRDIVVEIDPGMAFGTGQHASTRMCMEAIEDIIMKDRSIKDWKVLDVGCGTGILGITAAKMGAQDVVCVDNDPKATEIAAENAVINSVADRLHILKEDAMRIKEPRNLIIANLTAKLLLKMHAHLVRLLMPAGYMIISGIIEPDIPAIEEHFIVAPLVLQNKLTEKEWVCYVLRNNSTDGKS
ncbi:MAG: 50S ribosomal protein L11 methyltransferase [Deltaproteobacteria bacterium HGW-Deltaproteobacteria-5]|nr:MAG: 50S ribosomal protein L11 methyltransferase [Deltaproteobacteria bacterium HGW-Deltaproteobacteria-5]